MLCNWYMLWSSFCLDRITSYHCIFNWYMLWSSFCLDGGLSQAPTYVQAQAFSRLPQSFFSGRYGFSVLPLSLQSVIYSCNWPHRTSGFLESMPTVTLAYNTQQVTIIARQVPCPTHWESTTLVYLTIYGCCSQRFFGAIELASITNSKLHGRTFVRAHAQLSHVHLASTLDITHVIKRTRLSPSLVGRAWEREVQKGRYKTKAAVC